MKISTEILNAVHPEIKEVEKAWERIETLLEECESEYSDFILKLPNETDAKLRDRKPWFVNGFFNPTQDLVTAPVQYILRRGVTRKTDSVQLNKFISKADRSGQSLEEFIKNEAGPNLSSYGTVFAVVDKPSTPVSNGLEQLVFGMPYLTILSPEQVKNWGWNSDGSLEWFRYTQAAPVSGGIFEKATGGGIEFVTWTRTEYIKHDSEGNEIYRIAHNWGIVPVAIQASFVASGDTLGKSTFFSSSRHIIMGNNHLSIAQTEIAKYGSILLIDEADAPNPRKNVRDENTNQLKLVEQAQEADTMKVADMKNRPQYLEKNLDLITKALEMATWCFKQALEAESSGKEVSPLTGNLGTDAPKSGVSKAYDWADTDAMLYSRAMDLQAFEVQICRIEQTIMKDTKPFTIQYPTSFDVMDFGEKIQQIKDLQSVNFPSIEAIKASFKRLVPEITTSDELRKTIDVEIDGATIVTQTTNTPGA